MIQTWHVYKIISETHFHLIELGNISWIICQAYKTQLLILSWHFSFLFFAVLLYIKTLLTESTSKLFVTIAIWWLVTSSVVALRFFKFLLYFHMRGWCFVIFPMHIRLEKIFNRSNKMRFLTSVYELSVVYKLSCSRYSWISIGLSINKEIFGPKGLWNRKLYFSYHSYGKHVWHSRYFQMSPNFLLCFKIYFENGLKIHSFIRFFNQY